MTLTDLLLRPHEASIMATTNRPTAAATGAAAARPAAEAGAAFDFLRLLPSPEQMEQVRRHYLLNKRQHSTHSEEPPRQ
jgi:hypothetical protein